MMRTINGYDESVAESFPASDAPSHAPGGDEADPHAYGEHGDGRHRPAVREDAR